MIKNKKKYQVFSKKFSFLQEEFKCEFKEFRVEDWGCELLYTNSTTGIKITYEHREQYIFVMLYKLVKGEFLENPKNIDDFSHLYGFGLDDIINIKDSSCLLKSLFYYDSTSIFHDKNTGFDSYVEAFAKNLKFFGEDLLNGDFEIFQEIDKIVKERAKKYK